MAGELYEKIDAEVSGKGKIAMMVCPFTEDDLAEANGAWGCNCGPAALAFFLQVPIESVRGAIPGFEDKAFTSPSMMQAALRNLEQPTVSRMGGKEMLFDGQQPCLVRIQWTGPWTTPGANGKWAYCYTHWICTYMVHGQAPMIYDCNGGVRGYRSWMDEIVPAITSSIKRADGDWYPTHIWRKV